MLTLIVLFVYISFGDVPDDDSERQKAAGSGSGGGANATQAGGSKTDTGTSEDGNINISNVTNIVVGRVGNMFGKGIGGLSTKFGSGNWF